MIKLDALRPGQKSASDPFNGIPLLEFFRTSPLMAKNKVVLFERADRMSPSTANALLKTLEEPAPFGRIVMTTSELGRIMPTVRSRCLCVACELPERSEWSPADDVEAVFGGAPGLAERIQADRTIYDQLWELCWEIPTAPPGAALGLAERLRKLGEALSKAQGSAARGGHAEALRCLAQWASRRDPAWALAAVEAHRLIQGNANVAIVTDALMTGLAHKARPGTLV
jgi:DNA polymerase-3 subunit delta'